MDATLSAQQKKQLYVRVGLENDAGTVRAMARHRLTVAHVNKLFNADVEFLQEETSGVVVWPKHWPTDCLPGPALYIIRERVWPTLESDTLETHSYRGGTRIVIDNVAEAVTEASLLAWLRSGLEDDDPDFSIVKQQMTEAKNALALVQRAIEDLPTVNVNRRGGVGEGAPGMTSSSFDMEAKRDKTQALNAKRRDLEASLESNRHEWERVVAEQDALMREAFELRLVETKVPLRLNVWEAKFSKTPRAQKMAYIACHKFNWRDFRLKVHSGTGEALAGKTEELDDAPRAFREVNMREVTISRRKHGRGMFLFSDERGFYSGHWVRGIRHGTGSELNSLGRFQGTFAKDWRRGPGRQMYANGDLYRGPFGLSTNHPRESLLHGDEYADGLPHGRGSMQFVDGSSYDGMFKDGVPMGQGTYLGADGVALEGNFGEWGVLHGTGSESGVTTSRISTAWVHGHMHGNGTEISAMGQFEGAFSRGLKHGFGVENSEMLVGDYSGWWHLGERDGRGELNYNLSEGGGSAMRLQAGKAAATAAAGDTSATAVATLAVGGSSATPPLGPSNNTTPTSGASAGRPVRSSSAREGAAAAAAASAAHFIPYRGDVLYEGGWRMGCVRPGALITLRRGATEPTKHEMRPCFRQKNLCAPDLDALPVREKETRDRQEKLRASQREATLKLRLSKEADNSDSYAFWTARAHAQSAGVMKRTRRGRAEIDRIRQEVTGQQDTDSEESAAEEEREEEGAATAAAGSGSKT